MSNGYYWKAEGCDEALHAFCKRSCSNGGRLTLARFDRGDGESKKKWRCYDLVTLTDDTLRYAISRHLPPSPIASLYEHASDLVTLAGDTS